MITFLDEIPTLFEKYGVAQDVLEKISLWQGDITRLEVEAIVNAANNGLCGGGGIDGAIHRAAGTAELQKECKAIGYCNTGCSVITSGCNIKHIKHIIHSVGPMHYTGEAAPTDEEREELIACYRSSLQLVSDFKLKSIAFCCISTGYFLYPKEDAARTVVNFITEWLSEPENASKVERIVFVLFKSEDVVLYERFFDEYVNTQKC